MSKSPISSVFSAKYLCMKQLVVLLLLACNLFCACHNATPEKNFSQAALNCNYIFGFAAQGMQYEMANPSVKLVDEKTMATATMSRAEVLAAKLAIVDANFQKVKDLKVTDDSKEMINASIALYEYVLPVYKKEYKELADLYDRNGDSNEIAALEKQINERYAENFNSLYNSVQQAGLNYAKRHGLKVEVVNPIPN